MPTPKKVQQVVRIKDNVEKSGAVYFADISTLTAQALSDLRRKWKKDGIRLRVIKNRLAKRALVEAGIPAEVAAILRGPTSLVLGTQAEPYAAARMLKDAAQKHKGLQFKGAFVEQALFTAAQFDVLANMPTRPELQGQLVGVLQYPLYQLAAVLGGMISSLVLVLGELKDTRAQIPAAETVVSVEATGPEA